MLTYTDDFQLPKRSEVVQYSLKSLDYTPEEYLHWIDWVDHQGEIILKVTCSDGYVCLVYKYGREYVYQEDSEYFLSLQKKLLSSTQ
jgi:hypothetical protein